MQWCPITSYQVHGMRVSCEALTYCRWAFGNCSMRFQCTRWLGLRSVETLAAWLTAWLWPASTPFVVKASDLQPCRGDPRSSLSTHGHAAVWRPAAFGRKRLLVYINDLVRSVDQQAICRSIDMEPDLGALIYKPKYIWWAKRILHRCRICSALVLILQTLRER